MTARIRVLVVDDSAIARRFITARLEKDPEIELVGAAGSGSAALEAIRRDPPDVVVLDEEMPDMRGRDVLRVIRTEHPAVAVVMFSARVGSGREARFEALLLGADDAVSKPVSSHGPVGDGHPTWTELLTKAKAASRRTTRGGVDVAVARAVRPGEDSPAPAPGGSVAETVQDRPSTHEGRIGARGAGDGESASDAAVASAPDRSPSARPSRTPATGPSSRTGTTRSTSVPPPPRRTAVPVPDRRSATAGRRGAQPTSSRSAAAAGRSTAPTAPDQALCVIASSTGGPDALSQVFERLPADFPLPILVAQHMPPHFTRLLADRIDGRSALTVREAQGGEQLVRGAAFVAPGDHHLVVEAAAGTLRTALDLGPPENSCRPAADTLFRSAVDAVGGRIVACVISGMGHDGTAGARLIHEAGGTVLAQDEETSVVWGMPGAVVAAGVADRVLPLDRIATELTTAAQRIAGGARRARKALA